MSDAIVIRSFKATLYASLEGNFTSFNMIRRRPRSNKSLFSQALHAETDLAVEGEQPEEEQTAESVNGDIAEIRRQARVQFDTKNTAL